MRDVELIGGHPALDLVNTVAWRGDPTRRHDRLCSADDVYVWATRTGSIAPTPTAPPVIDPPSGETGPDHLLGRVRDLREDLHRILTDDDRDAAAMTVHSAIAGAVGAAQPVGLPWRWHVDPTLTDRLVHVAALAAHDLLTSDAVLGVRRCEDTACGWLFLDHTRNHSRRWCSSQDCGNRARARRHRRRTTVEP